METLVHISNTGQPHIDGGYVPYFPPSRHDAYHLIRSMWLEPRLGRLEKEVHKR